MSSKHLGFKFLIALFLVFFSISFSHNLIHSLIALFSFFSLTLIHSPSGFLYNYKTHFQFSLCCYKYKQIVNNIIHGTSWLWRLKVPMDPSVKPWHSFQLCRQFIVVVDSNLDSSERGVRLDLDHGYKIDPNKDFKEDDMQDEIEEKSEEIS